MPRIDGVLYLRRRSTPIPLPPKQLPLISAQARQRGLLLRYAPHERTPQRHTYRITNQGCRITLFASDNFAKLQAWLAAHERSPELS